MDNLSKKKFKIILIHILWEVFIVSASLNCDSFNHTISDVSFFLIEPINLFVVYPIVVYAIINRIIRKEPYTVKDEKNHY